MSSPKTLRITIAALLAAAAATALAEAPAAPDTSNWKCESCPFQTGYEADATLGAIDANGANAAYGRYTGLDRSKGYADVAAHGESHSDGGSYTRYALDDLGLDSRSGRISVGRDGRYAVTLSYAGQPHYLYDATVTPYVAAGSATLPAGWVPAGSTAGMTDLAASLHGVKIGTIRKTAGLAARGILGSGVTLFGSVTHETKRGTDILGSAFLVQATQIAAAVDYQTDTAEAGVAWAGKGASLRFVLSDSKFKDAWSAYGFQNPYTPLVPSAQFGMRALPPDNDARAASLSGSLALPGNTSGSLAASYSRLTQDQALLPSSTLPGATVPGAFDGRVNLAHIAATIGSRPLERLSLHARIAHDQRNDDSTPLVLTQVVTDVAVGATLTTPRYDYTRTRADGGADLRLAKWLTAGIGADRVEVNRTEQVARHTEDGQTYGRLRLAPLAGLAITLKGGAAHREARGIDLTLLPVNENPLLAIFNLSNRDRDFFELNATWAASATVSLGLQGQWANDDYRRSTLGLLSGRERRGGATFSWTPSEALSFYADGGYQTRRTLQAGEYSTGAAFWEAAINDRYWNAAAGGRYVHGRWELSADYAHAVSAGDTGVGATGLLAAYPQLRTRYDNAGLSAGYQLTPALKLRLRYVYQNYASDDWALDGVGPATIPNLLALGVPATAYNVNVIALSASYRFGTPPAAAKSE